MRRAVTTGLLVAAVVFMCHCLASAQSAPPETLHATYIDHGYYANGLNVSNGVDAAVGSPVTINCPGPGACTIQADQFIQVGLVGISCGEFPCFPGQLTVGFYLDGVAAIDEQIVGVVPASGYQVEATSELQNGVSPGSHTVQIFVNCGGNGAVFNYNTNFRVYKP
jgi:hypothetical protein